MGTPGLTLQKMLFGILSTFCGIVGTVKMLQLLWQHLCAWICPLPAWARSRCGPVDLEKSSNLAWVPVMHP